MRKLPIAVCIRGFRERDASWPSKHLSHFPDLPNYVGGFSSRFGGDVAGRSAYSARGSLSAIGLNRIRIFGRGAAPAGALELPRDMIEADRMYCRGRLWWLRPSPVRAVPTRPCSCDRSRELRQVTETRSRHEDAVSFCHRTLRARKNWWRLQFSRVRRFRKLQFSDIVTKGLRRIVLH